MSKNFLAEKLKQKKLQEQVQTETTEQATESQTEQAAPKAKRDTATHAKTRKTFAQQEDYTLNIMEEDRKDGFVIRSGSGNLPGSSNKDLYTQALVSFPKELLERLERESTAKRSVTVVALVEYALRKLDEEDKAIRVTF